MDSRSEVIVQVADFSVDEENTQLLKSHALGAVVNFIGLVRQNEAANLVAMHIEHYPEMTEGTICDVIQQAESRWPLQSARVVHRVGTLAPGDQIVYVGVSATHRQDAFNGCSFIMDFLKTQAPFWKKESFSSGEERWVESKLVDQQASEKWAFPNFNSET